MVYTPNGTELGFFRNVRREDKMFSTVDFNRHKSIYKKRLSNCPGCTVPEEQLQYWINGYADMVNSDGIVVAESRTKLGLGSLLIKESPGLGKLLN